MFKKKKAIWLIQLTAGTRLSFLVWDRRSLFQLYTIYFYLKFYDQNTVQMAYSYDLYDWVTLKKLKSGRQTRN